MFCLFPWIPRCGAAPAAFVGGLSWGTDDKGLYEAFARFGNVVEAKVRGGRAGDPDVPLPAFSGLGAPTPRVPAAPGGRCEGGEARTGRPSAAIGV